MAQIPIEILTAGDQPDDHLERAITAANTLQSEFSYSLFPEEAQADFRAFVVGHIKDDDALDRIDEARKRPRSTASRAPSITGSALRAPNNASTIRTGL